MEQTHIDAATASPAFASFTVETKALADAVAFLAKRVTERRNTIPILSHIAFMVDLPGRVTMTASDLDNFASVEIAADVATPGNFTADASALADVVAKLGKVKGSYSVGIEDKGDRVRVYAGRNEYKLNRLPIDDFPAMTLSDPTPLAFTLPAGRFLSDLAALAPCVSTDGSRYYLEGVALQVRALGGRDRFAMVATDGHKIGVASRELPEGAAALPDPILPRKAASILCHAAKLSPTCDVLGVEFYREQGDGAGKFRFTLGGVVVECREIKGTFPAWEHCWDDQLAPTGEALPMFPELLPAAPLTHMQAIEKAVKADVIWEPARDGMSGTLPGDPDILFAAINPKAGNLEPVKGYKVTFQADQEAAGRYLVALADQRAGRTVARDKCRLQVMGGEVLGLTVGNWEFEQGRYEERPNWETLHVEKVWIEGRNVYETGAYSEVMPRDRAKMRPDVTLEIDGDATVYPLGVKSGAIHLTKDQVRAIAGDSVFETMAVEIAGRAVYILRWLWEQGDSRFLTVRPDGRTFKGGEIVTRAEIEAALRGEIAEPAPMPVTAAPAPNADVCKGEIFPGETWDYVEQQFLSGFCDRNGVWVDVSRNGRGALRCRSKGRSYSSPIPAAILPRLLDAMQAGATAPEPAQSESAPIVAQEGGEAVNALHGPEIAPDELLTIADELPAPADEPAPATVNESLTVPPAVLDAITARLDALEHALATLSAEKVQVGASLDQVGGELCQVATPTARAKRTPAHERAIRRAWAERKARRYAQSVAEQAERYARGADARAERTAREHADQVAALEQSIADWEAFQHRTWTESMGFKVKRRRAVLNARRHWKMRLLARHQYQAAERESDRERAGRHAIAATGRALTLNARRERDMALATVAQLKRDMADPTTPDRASDVARLVRERDEARTALAAVTERAKRAEQGLESMADRFTSLVSRVTKAEAALRERVA